MSRTSTKTQRIEYVCTFCENKAIGAADPDAPRSKPPMCKVHFRIALAGEDHPFWPVMHPDGYCDRGGECHVGTPPVFESEHED